MRDTTNESSHHLIGTICTLVLSPNRNFPLLFWEASAAGCKIFDTHKLIHNCIELSDCTPNVSQSVMGEIWCAILSGYLHLTYAKESLVWTKASRNNHQSLPTHVLQNSRIQVVRNLNWVKHLICMYTKAMTALMAGTLTSNNRITSS